MITLIKDISKKYRTTNRFIEVKNLDSYFNARKSFFQNYKDVDNFEIIIKNKNYFSYFLDFEGYENVKVRLIENIEDVGEPKVTFGSSENIFEILLNCLNNGVSTKETIKILDKKYFQEYNFLFKENYESIDEILEVLVKIVVFSNYKECNFNILLDSNFVKEMYLVAKTDDKLQESYYAEKENLIKYTNKCNEVLLKNRSKMQLFSDFPTDKYLLEINGKLEFEEKYFIEKTVERLNLLKNFINIKENLIRAEKVFDKKYTNIINLIEILILLEKESKKEKNTLNEHREYFSEIYLNYNSISLDKNIEELINSIEKKYQLNLLSLKRSIKNIWAESNKNFEEFYLRNYSNLYSSQEQKGLDYALENSFSLLNNGKKNLYIFIDCLRYDIWLGIKRYMQEKGWNCHLDKIVLSAIPSVTSYCKKILYTGKKYNQIENKDYFKVDIKNVTDIQELNNTENDNLLYEILDLDSLFHGIKGLTEESIYTFLKAKLDKVLNEIEQEKYNIIIMTDHGTTKLYEEGFSSFAEYRNILSDKGLEIENHGRYIKVYSKSFRSELYDELNSYFNNQERDFYIINRENMSKYYLPVAENSIENYFYFIYKYGKYPKNTSEYNHGGISYEEIFIPYGIFKKEPKEFNPISLEVKTPELKNSIRSEIIILLKNSNILQNVKIKLKYQEFEKEYSELEGNKLIQVPLKIDENFEGEYTDIVEVEYIFEGKLEIFKSSISINILKNQKATINKKLKQSRALL